MSAFDDLIALNLVPLVHRILGIPLEFNWPRAPEEVRRFKLSYRFGDRSKAMALWTAYSKRKTASATTVDEAILAYVSSPDGPCSQQAREKWDNLSRLEVLSANTLAEIILVEARTLFGSHVRFLAQQKWQAISMKMVKEATTLLELIIIRHGTMDTFESRKIAESELLRLRRESAEDFENQARAILNLL